MGEKYAWCTRHGQQIGVGSKGVFLNGVLSCIGTFLRIVIFNECHCILAIDAVVIVVAYQGPVTIILFSEIAPVIIVDGITNGVSELEVKGGARFICAVNPAFYLS